VSTGEREASCSFVEDVIEPQPVSDLAASWVAQHRNQGHRPYPAPAPENPERWDCDCGYIWRSNTYLACTTYVDGVVAANDAGTAGMATTFLALSKCHDLPQERLIAGPLGQIG
jgi:ABC-type xylose transport system substrate-binding protein